MPGSKLTDSSEPQAAPGATSRRRRPGSKTAPTATPVNLATPLAGSSVAPKPGRNRPPRPVHQAPSSRPLAETAGPDPETPLSEVRLAIGSIGSPHGTGGDLRLRLLTDDPQHLLRIKRVYVGDELAPRELLSIRFHAGLGLIRLSGVRNPDDARALLGQTVRISGRDARPLAAGEFYFYQVIGLTAFDEGGVEIGTVTDILETGANDVFVITPGDGGKEMLLPNIPSVILEINSSARRMTVRPLVYWESPAQQRGLDPGEAGPN